MYHDCTAVDPEEKVTGYSAVKKIWDSAMCNEVYKYVISVLVADRVGILSALTSAVTDMGANIEGISQTVVQGYFTVILIANFKTRIAEHTVHDAILSNFRKGEVSVLVKPFNPDARTVTKGERYILTMSGNDQPGILKKLTVYLAEKKINVEDLYFQIKGEHVTHIGEVTVPRPLDVKQVQDELRELMMSIGMVVSLQHENLFRATNEIGTISLMLKEKPDA